MLFPAGIDFDSFRALIDAGIPFAYLFHASRLEGLFKSVRTSSVPRQHKPCRPLVEAVRNQSAFDFQDAKEVVFGFYCPPFVKGIKVPGYHTYFLTADRTAGGHVLGFTVGHAALKIDTLTRFFLQLPETKGFATGDLRRDRKAELEQVEK